MALEHIDKAEKQGSPQHSALTSESASVDKKDTKSADKNNSTSETHQAAAGREPAAAKETLKSVAAVSSRSSVPQTKTSNKKTIINSITFDNSTKQGEMVLFKMNRFFSPEIFGVVEGQPRVVCDFQGVSVADTVKPETRVNGAYIRSIEVKKDNPASTKVILELEPKTNYDIQQVYFKEDQLFVIIINEDNKNK